MKSAPRYNTGTASQDPHLAALERYLRQKGHLVVSHGSDAALYKWATHQRHLWRCGRLDFELQRRLDAIGFPFELEDCEWEHVFAHVARCRRVQGRLPLPTSRAGQWLQHQRELRQSGKLPRKREARLAAEGAFELAPDRSK